MTGKDSGAGQPVERRKNPAPWSVEGLADRVSKLEGLVSALSVDLERQVVHITNLENRMDRSYDMHVAQTKMIEAQTEVLTKLSANLDKMQEVLGAWENVKSTVTIMKLLGDTAKWVIGLTLAGTAFFAMLAKKIPWF